MEQSKKTTEAENSVNESNSAKETRICPICGKKYAERSALSRRDNTTMICPSCGMDEALEDYRAYLKTKEGSKNAFCSETQK